MENFVESDDINVTTEDFMFEVIENWVKHDLETRKIFFSRLFHNVRLPLVSDEYLNAKIVMHDLFLQRSHQKILLNLYKACQTFALF
jgi:hypothetical protein